LGQQNSDGRFLHIKYIYLCRRARRILWKVPHTVQRVLAQLSVILLKCCLTFYITYFPFSPFCIPKFEAVDIDKNMYSPNNVKVAGVDEKIIDTPLDRWVPLNEWRQRPVDLRGFPPRVKNTSINLEIHASLSLVRKSAPKTLLLFRVLSFRFPTSQQSSRITIIYCTRSLSPPCFQKSISLPTDTAPSILIPRHFCWPKRF